nr:hypothetical protein [Tanacetum cinerariifolium]
GGQELKMNICWEDDDHVICQQFGFEE